MLFRVFVSAGLAATLCASLAQGQALRGPAEIPPASYKGQQYVDSRGCVFLRAGIGGRVNWVARVTAGRRALCGQPPSGRAVAVAEEAVAAPQAMTASAAPQSRASVSPLDKSVRVTTPPTIRAANKPALPVPVRVAAAPDPARLARSSVAPAAVRLMNGCPKDAPYGARVTLTDGRKTLICSADAGFDPVGAARRADVARQAAASPAYAPPVAAKPVTPKRTAQAAGQVCPASAPFPTRFALRGGGFTVMCADASGSTRSATPRLTAGVAGGLAVADLPPVPKGYKRAWKDDRLNPRRGQGTAQGQAAQDQVWTRQTPARLVTDAPKRQKTGPVVISASNTPLDAGYFVQVGTFGVPANAKSTAVRLSALGLPVSAARVTRNGQAFQVVSAGPFESAGQAKAALSAAHRAGFGDAYIR